MVKSVYDFRSNELVGQSKNACGMVAQHVGQDARSRGVQLVVRNTLHDDTTLAREWQMQITIGTELYRTRQS